MKTKKVFFILFAVLISSIAKLQAQDYQISFAGSGASTTVETVQVQNLTKGISLTLNGSDVLHLIGTTGIKSASASDKSLRIYPNPMTNNCNIEFEVSKAGVVIVDLFDITGKKVSSLQNDLPSGLLKFNVNGLNSGVYTITITTENGIFSSKIISNCKDAGTATIKYINSTETTARYTNSTVENIETLQLRSAQTTVDMSYTNGDRILLKGISGNYSTIITLVPIANSTQTFNFVAATDYDGNNYTTVTIGTQVWMVENLKVTTYNDGIAIPNVTDNTAWANLTTGAYCNYNNDAVNGTKYGKLYNWYAVNTGKLAPAGWHVPSDGEWTTLQTYLIANGYNYDATTTGNKIAKSLAATTDWSSSINTGAIGNDLTLNNSTGFSALPGGSRYYEGLFGSLGYAYWWSSTEYDTDKARNRYLFYINTNLLSYYYSKVLGYSVRCVKD